MKIEEKNAEVVVDVLIRRIKSLECDCWLFAEKEQKLHEQIKELNKQIEELKKGGEPFGEL